LEAMRQPGPTLAILKSARAEAGHRIAGLRERVSRGKG
jgi:hypothetical protein